MSNEMLEGFLDSPLFLAGFTRETRNKTTTDATRGRNHAPNFASVFFKHKL